MKNGHILCPNWLSGHRKSRFSDGLGGVPAKVIGERSRDLRYVFDGSTILINRIDRWLDDNYHTQLL